MLVTCFLKLTALHWQQCTQRSSCRRLLHVQSLCKNMGSQFLYEVAFCAGHAGSGSSGTATRSAGDSVQEVSVLSDVWNIKPEELQICTRPDGSEWLLGTGSFGQVRSPAGCYATCDKLY